MLMVQSSMFSPLHTVHTVRWHLSWLFRLRWQCG